MKKGFIGLLLVCLMLGCANSAFASDVVTERKEQNLKTETSIPMIDLVSATPINQKDDIEGKENTSQTKEDQTASLEILSPEDGFVTTDREVSLSVSAINGDSIDVVVYKSGEDSPTLIAKDLEIKDIGICIHELEFKEAGKYTIYIKLKDEDVLILEEKASISIVDKKEARKYMKETIEKLDIENVLKQVIDNKDKEEPAKIDAKENISIKKEASTVEK